MIPDDVGRDSIHPLIGPVYFVQYSRLSLGSLWFNVNSSISGFQCSDPTKFSNRYVAGFRTKDMDSWRIYDSDVEGCWLSVYLKDLIPVWPCKHQMIVIFQNIVQSEWTASLNDVLQFSQSGPSALSSSKNGSNSLLLVLLYYYYIY